jgi:hypothetical protein
MSLEGILCSYPDYFDSYKHLREWARVRWNKFPLSNPRHIDHGPEHSAEVHKWMDKILEPKLGQDPYFLTHQEAFICLASAYLHDIGMQYGYNNYEFPDGIRIQNDLDKLSPEERRLIREYHAEIGGEAIRRFKCKLPRALARKLTPGQKEVIQNLCGILAYVCQSHNTKGIRNCDEEIQSRGSFGEFRGQIKILFLAALLQAADALHMDKSRVDETELIEIAEEACEGKGIFELSDEEIRRYFLCYYIDCVRLEPIDSSKEIVLSVRYPRSMDRNLLRDFVVKYYERLVRGPDDCLTVLHEEGIIIHVNPLPKMAVEFNIQDIPCKLTLLPPDLPDFPPRHDIIDRESEIDEILAGLDSDCSTLLIYGPAGVGKTALALELLYRIRGKRRFWIDCQGIGSIYEFVAEFQKWLSENEKEEVQKIIKGKAPESIKKDRILNGVGELLSLNGVLFLDGCENIFDTELMESLRKLEGTLKGGKMVITARSQPSPSFSNMTEVKLNGLRKEDSGQLLERHGLKCESDEALEHIQRITQGRPKLLQMLPEFPTLTDILNIESGRC